MPKFGEQGIYFKLGGKKECFSSTSSMSPTASTSTSAANNLLTLVQELRELIAASSSSSSTGSTPLNSNRENDDALDSRFRSVLHEYVVPSPSGKAYLLLFCDYCFI